VQILGGRNRYTLSHIPGILIPSPPWRSLPVQGCSASPHSDDNLFVWSATIFGPDETAWEGERRPPYPKDLARVASEMGKRCLARRDTRQGCRRPLSHGTVATDRATHAHTLRADSSRHHVDVPPSSPNAPQTAASCAYRARSRAEGLLFFKIHQMSLF